MSEVNDLVSDFESILRKKPILMSEISSLESSKKILREEVDDLLIRLDTIKNEIEADKSKAKESIRVYNENQNRVIKGELDRLEKISESVGSKKEQVDNTEARQNQKENELRGWEHTLIERERKADKADADAEAKLNDINLRDTDITTKLSKVQRYIKETRGILDEDRKLKEENEIVRKSNKEQNEELKRKTEFIKSEEARLKAYSDELDVFKISLEKLQSKVNKDVSEYNSMNEILSKRKKDLDDQQRCFESEKAEVALRIAKKNAK